MLELTRELGNVAQACRRRGMDRTSFQEGKGRLQTHRFECSKDLPPIHKSPPQTSPPEAIEKIKALDRPACGCNRFEAILAPQGIRVSLITIPKILNGTGLGTRPDRWLALKVKHADEAITLRAEQIACLEKPPPSPSRKTREIRRIGQVAFRRHLRPRHTQGRRHGLSARGGRHLWQLRPRLASPVSNPPEGETQAPLMEGMAPAPPASQCAVVGAVILIHEGRHP